MSIVDDLRKQCGKPIALKMGNVESWGILLSADEETIKMQLVSSDGKPHGNGCFDSNDVTGFVLGNPNVDKACLNYLYDHCYKPKQAPVKILD